MSRRSAGILAFRRRDGHIEVLLVHPGGPFWRGRDAGAWSIPKGEHGPDEPPEAAARRESTEETSWTIAGQLLDLGEVRQRAGKFVSAFAVEADFDPATLVSSTFELEWPPRSGRRQGFPEIDRAAWFDLDEARRRILPAQAALIDELASRLASAER